MLAVALAVALAQAPSASSRQQEFEAANAAAERSDWADAFARFDVLEKKLAGGKSARSLALVRVRKGEALLGLGRVREAEASVRAGLAALPTTDPNLLGDRVFANLMRASIAERDFDYSAAYRAYGDALIQGADTPLATQARVGAARAGAFVDPRAAAAHADAGLAAVTGTDKPSKELRVQWRTLKGRALLNAGDFAGASAELERATKELGGLTIRVSYSDIVARSDLAIAALLAGRPEKAREYLAYTGAGRFETTFMPTPFRYPLPACGAGTGLRPDDVAVVELSILDNGRVAAATPIYGSRIGVAATLAKSVKNWSWNDEGVAKISPFFRQATRVEVRCQQVPERVSVQDLIKREHDDWVASQLASQGDDALADLPLATLRARFAASGTGVPARLALARAIAEHRMADRVARRETAAQAVALAESAKAPPMVLGYWLLEQASLDAFDASVPVKERAVRYRGLLNAAAERPVIHGDMRAQAALALLSVETFSSDVKAERTQAEAVFRRIADNPALAPDDALRTGGRVRLANLLSNTDRADEARRVYADVGLPDGRCPILDAERAMQRSGADSGDFPMAAMNWGFEGWATTESVIGADRASAVRTLIAYPPFVFGEAAQGVARSMRYRASYRPASEAACGGQTVSVRFALPKG